MSLIRPSALSKLNLKTHAILYTAVRNHWNKDYKPGPFPKTPEERAAAAKKYEILPSSLYQPYPNDGSGLGDYPNLPLESGDSKDPNYPWDNPELKRNFNEPMHADFDMIGEDRYDVNARHRVSGRKQFAQTAGFLLITFGIYYFCEDMKWFLALAEKQYPNTGQKHYTFETE